MKNKIKDLGFMNSDYKRCHKKFKTEKWVFYLRKFGFKPLDNIFLN